MVDLAIYGLCILVFWELATLAVGAGALVYLCCRMDKILRRLRGEDV